MSIQVYLDSSDYSTLSGVDCNQNVKLATVREQLFDLRDSGVCEFRYSYVHIIEMTPIDQASLTFAKARLGLLQALCGKKCFLPTDILDREELLAALKNLSADTASGKKIEAKNDAGFWLPGGFDFLEKHADGIVKTIDGVRKTAAKKGLRDQRKINFAIQSLIGTQLDAYAEMLPINAAMKQKLLFKAVGQMSKSFGIEILREGFTDFPLFADWAVSSEVGRKFAGLLRTRAQLPLEGVEKIRAMLHELKLTSANDRIGMQKGVAAMNQGFDSATSEYQRAFVDKTVSQSLEYFEAHGFTQSEISRIDMLKLSLPRLNTHIALYEENFRRNSTTERNLAAAKSDMGDILHANYLPYVNIIRADKFSSGVCKQLADDFCVHVVSDLLSLPKAIREYVKDVAHS